MPTAMALYLEGATSLGESKIGPWPLGGIAMFIRDADNDDGRMEVGNVRGHISYAVRLQTWFEGMVSPLFDEKRGENFVIVEKGKR
ncbi:hypothetical protein ACHAXA_009876 [Cyclostephanos tholiformis]|uniref:Uncharacterized protein n=1 Tax=Cyclostephanos tholiformis TaxID=382380 RepID=A0ABD3RKN5_9STRA